MTFSLPEPKSYFIHARGGGYPAVSALQKVPVLLSNVFAAPIPAASLDAEVRPEVDRGEQVLDSAERIIEEMDCDVETDMLQAREVGPAIVDEAIERGVDLVTLGFNYKKKFGEFTLGDIIPYVLKNAPCWVIVCRGPISEEEE